MAGKNSADQFANLAIISVTESAANTLTYKKLETGISLNEKVAWIINRIEYNTNEWNQTTFNGDGDYQMFGLSVSNMMTTIQAGDPMVVDFNACRRKDIGAAATGTFQFSPWIKELSSLPGGGLILPPQPIYLFAVGSGLTAASSITARLYYTLLQLSVDQYWELVEARRVLAS